MAHLTIKNFGPIKDIDIDLKRLNVFIGPQSSGKSSIAKVISFCQWLGKDCVRRQRVSHVDKDFTDKLFIEYHNVGDYVTEDTYFRYKDDILTIEYIGGVPTVKRGEGFKQAGISKNAYIPSERNLISVPGIFTTKMPFNYIKSFLDDWQQVRSRYGKEHTARIAPTHDSYYFDEGSDTDMILMPGGATIHLSQASSGMQSVTPLAVYVNYLTDWIYTHEEMQSAEETRNLEMAALAKAIESRSTGETKIGFLDYMNDEDTPPDIEESFRSVLESIRGIGALAPENTQGILKDMVMFRKELSRPRFSNLVIEEPEQNLFPETQCRLIEHILGNMNHERDKAVITTHSPFVLYSINNCMVGYLAAQKDPEAIKEMTDIPTSAFIDPKEVCVRELRDGHIIGMKGEENGTIQDERGLIRDNYFNRVMGNVMGEFRNLLGML